MCDASKARADASVATKTPRRKLARRPGFSLIEVLVVVGIVSLLIGLIVPSLITARERTRLIMCQSNQRNIVFAWHAYLKDYGDRLPRGYLIGTTFGGKQGSPDLPESIRDAYRGARLLNRYLGMPAVTENSHTAAVFACPGDGGGLIANVQPDPIHSRYFDLWGTSYRCNRFVVGPVPPETSWYDPCQALMNKLRLRFDTLSLNVASFSNESRLVMLGDYGFDDWQNPASTWHPVEFHARSYRSSSEIPYDPMYASHQNIAFVDGHVNFVQIRKGIHVCSAYTVIPFRDMQSAFAEDQKQGYFP